MAATDLFGLIWSNASDGFFSIESPDVDSLEFDSIQAEVHDWQRDVTDNPVENDAPVSDHIIERPRNLTVTGMISNSPISGANIFFSGSDSSEDRVADAFNLLNALYKSKSLVTIYTRYAQYEDMVITSINIPRSPDQGNSITFTIQAKQIRIVSTQKTELPTGLGVKKNGDGKSNSKDADTQKRGGANKDNGKSTTEVSTTDVDRSSVKSLLNFLSWIF